jgi:hypothetical protein
MHGYPFTNSDPDRGNLAILHPDARETFPTKTSNLVMAEDINDNVFQKAEILMQITAVLG